MTEPLWTPRHPSADVRIQSERSASTSTDVAHGLPTTSYPLQAAIPPIIANDPIGLTAVWSPSRPILDIIFVHGLGGTSGKTWCHDRDPGTFWPSWLHDEPELSHARVHTFGYSASIVGAANSSGIFDFAGDLLFKMKYEYVNFQKGPPIGSVCVPFSNSAIHREGIR